MNKYFWDKPITPLILGILFLAGLLCFFKVMDDITREKDKGEWHNYAVQYTDYVNEQNWAFDDITPSWVEVNERSSQCPYVTGQGRYCKFVEKTLTQKGIIEIEDGLGFDTPSRTIRVIVFERQDDGGVKANVVELE